jgi:hypothetical protein
MIHEEICTYEVCKLAREKGFDVQTFDWYDYTGNYQKGFIPHKLHECPRYKEYYAPTQSLLQRWLREEKNTHIEIIATASGYYWCINKTNGTSITDSDILNRGTNAGGCFDTYELALEDALKYVLKNLV